MMRERPYCAINAAAMKEFLLVYDQRRRGKINARCCGMTQDLSNFFDERNWRRHQLFFISGAALPPRANRRSAARGALDPDPGPRFGCTAARGSLDAQQSARPRVKAIFPERTNDGSHRFRIRGRCLPPEHLQVGRPRRDPERLPGVSSFFTSRRWACASALAQIAESQTVST
jgi:hypothetical protein